MTATSITMYETAGGGFSPVRYYTTTLTTVLHWGRAHPARALEWRDLVIARLAELERLAPGWDSDGGLPVARRHANRAMQFLVRLAADEATSLPVPDIVPLADGGVQLEWHVAPDRRIDFVSDEDSEPMILVQNPTGFNETPVRLADATKLRALLSG